MRVNPNRLRPLFVALCAVLALSANAFAQEAKTKEAFPQVKIKNFGQMDERLFRGAEPKKLEDFQALKELGITTVVDLQAEPEPAERQMVESLGMTYVNIPMIAKKYPKSEHVAQFLKLVDDPATGKFFIHCAGGRHRTGVMGAVYRFNKYGWNYDQVYKEMKQFDFYTSWGHGDFKEFVQDYWQQVQTTRPASPVTQAAPATQNATGSQQQQQ
ncbi:MAG TPA: tyrosine-protein phosphatase [Pyrinomonadaceae bacterium]|nr:tyrosine-protein phosphatase [Pyrinomonadaceae bacterium]